MNETNLTYFSTLVL